MSHDSRHRHPKGTPTGGQFAASEREEADLELASPPSSEPHQEVQGVNVFRGCPRYRGEFCAEHTGDVGVHDGDMEIWSHGDPGEAPQSWSLRCGASDGAWLPLAEYSTRAAAEADLQALAVKRTGTVEAVLATTSAEDAAQDDDDYETLHSVAEHLASDVNNSGVEAQIAFLRRLGVPDSDIDPESDLSDAVVDAASEEASAHYNAVATVEALEARLTGEVVS